MRKPKVTPARSARKTPLDAGQIRLFRLYAARSTSDNEAGSDPITGDFVIINISNDDDDSHHKDTGSPAATSKPAYECLPYVWGEFTNQRTVTLDGEDVHITQNLYTALLHLRAAIPAAEGRKLRNGNIVSARPSHRALWIDALCIDQDNLNERSRQVGFMGSIYRGAERVIAFLGEAWDGHEMVLEFLKLAAEDPGRHITPSEKPFLQARGHDTSSPVFINSLLRLFQAKWFTRIWIVQEFVNAKQVFFQLGHTIANARQLHNGFLNIKRHIWSDCCGVQPWLIEPLPFPNSSHIVIHGREPETIITNVLLVVGWYEDLSELRWERGTLTALDNLSIFRRGGCTDTRDRVYASFGLPLPGDATWNMPVDYTISANRVFTNVTFSLITYMQSLDILSHIILQPQRCAFSPAISEDDPSNSKVVPESLASYVVDWSAPMTDSVYARYRSRMVASLGGGDHACRNTTASFVQFDHPTMGPVATTKGVFIGRIKTTGKTAAPDDIITDAENAAAQIRNIVLEAREMVGLPVYTTDNETSDHRFTPPEYSEASKGEIDLWRTLCGNTATSHELGDHLAWRPVNVEEDYNSFVQWWRTAVEGPSQSQASSPVAPPLKKQRTNRTTLQVARREAEVIVVGGARGLTGLTRSSSGMPLPGLGVEGFEGASASNIAARRFFCTADGKIGFALRDSRPGDLIVLLAGGKIPYVLRRHELVGEQEHCSCAVAEKQERVRHEVGDVMERSHGEKEESEGVFYTFLGDAYVDGSMEGDGTDDSLIWQTLMLK